MKHVANSRFAIKSWDEKPYSEGSGTGQLRDLRGEGTSAVGHGSEHPLTLNYELG